MARIVNLGIVAHVDAGKTSLTERLLHHAGVIDEVGSVDAGTTQTDTLALERRRGITIKAAVVSFAIGDVTVNLIDTPGHPDFIAEVERVLGVLDGAVLVISAVEGVQPQTRVLMRTLRRLRIPTLLFVNKIDRAGARHDGVLHDIAEKLTPAIVPMGATSDLGGRHAHFRPFDGTDSEFVTSLADVVSAYDDQLLAAYVDDETTVSYAQLRASLAAQTRQARVHPVYFGSAVTGAGVSSLATGIAELLPAAAGDANGPVSGTVFKVERGPTGEKVAYVRMFSGTVRTRDRLRFGQPAPTTKPPWREAKVTAVGVFDQGAVVPRAAVTAGQIGQLRGLSTVRVGDVIGDVVDERTGAAAQYHFAPPTWESVVVPRRAADRGALHAALTQLAEQDPLINLRQDDVRQEIFVSLYGEVQKEVIQETLASDYGIDVEFRETTTICVERPNGTGAAVEFKKTGDNPFLATVGLRITPAPVGSGVTYQRAVEVHGTMPPAFFAAVEETVYETLRQGLYGWQVTDCVVTMTHSGYFPRQSRPHQGFDKSVSSTAGDFRNLTPLVLMSALRQAGTTVYEPMHRFRLETPTDTVGTLLPVLARLRAVPHATTAVGTTSVVEGEIPAAHVPELQRQLPALTRGEGLLESRFDRYQPVTGTVPTRPRTDHNPLHRKEYLLRVQRKGFATADH